MHDAPQSLMLAGAAVALLRLYGRRKRVSVPPTNGDRDRMLCAAAMVQAAFFARNRHRPPAVRTAAVRSVLSCENLSVEQTLGGRRGLRSGLRRYLRLVAKPIAGFGDVQVLDAVADYLRTARLLHRASSATLRAGLCTALHRAAAMDDAGQVHELAICARSLARRSGPGQRTLGSEDAAVIWLYGVRAAWLWRAAGGGRSPFLRVSRASLKAAEQLLGQEPVGLGES